MKNKRGIAITTVFQKNFNDSNRKPNKKRVAFQQSRKDLLHLINRTSDLSGQEIRTFQNRTSGLSRSRNGLESKNLIFNINNNAWTLAFTFANVTYMIIYTATKSIFHPVAKSVWFRTFELLTKNRPVKTFRITHSFLFCFYLLSFS